jgi:hypothetical protein
MQSISILILWFFFQTQARRCCEILALKRLKSMNPDSKKLYHSEVKKRLWKLYEDQLEGLGKQDVYRHLEDLYQQTENDYHTILNRLSPS